MSDYTHDTLLGDVQTKLIELEGQGIQVEFFLEADGNWGIRDVEDGTSVEQGEL